MSVSVKSRLIGPVLSATTKLGNIIHPNRNVDPILISGSPRGGTTWVAESIAGAFNSQRIMWEPLQDSNIYRHGLGLSCRPVVNENNVDTEVDLFFNNLLNAQFASSHTARLRHSYKNLYNLLSNDTLIVKFVRGNGVLGYLRRKYSLPKPLVVVRHPCAVVSSQLSMGAWNDHPHIDEETVLENPSFQRILCKQLSLHERLALTWAGDVKNALRDRSDLHLVFYEDLVINDGAPMEEVFKDWGANESFFNYRKIIEKPSSTTHHWADHSSKEAKLNSWNKRLSTKQIDDIYSIVNDLGISFYK